MQVCQVINVITIGPDRMCLAMKFLLFEMRKIPFQKCVWTLSMSFLVRANVTGISVHLYICIHFLSIYALDITTVHIQLNDKKSFYLMTRSMIVSKCHVSLKLDESLMKLSDCALNVYTSTDTSF